MLAGLLLLLGLITHLLAQADSAGGAAVAFGNTPAVQAAPSPAERHPPLWRWAERCNAALAGQPSSAHPGIGPGHRLLLLLLGSGLVLSGLYCLLQLALERAVQWSTQQVTLALRTDLYNQHVRLGGVDLASRRQAGLGELMDDRMEAVREAVAQWHRSVPYATAAVPLLTLLALKAQLWVAVVALLLIALNWLWVERWQQRMRRHRALWSDRLAQQTASLLETLQQVRYGGLAENGAGGDSIAAQLARLEQAAQGREAGQSALAAVQVFFLAATVALLLALAGANVLRTPPKTTVAETVLLTAALLCLADPAQRLFQLRASMARADRAARAIFSYLDHRPLVDEAAAPVAVKRLTRACELEAVTLDDPGGVRLLDNVSLRIVPGSRVALLSTQPRTLWGLAGLLCRWFDPTAGHVRLDGVDLRQADFASLRNHVHALLSDGLLFPGSLSENVGGGRHGESEIAQALRRVGAYEWVQRLPQGLATPVGDHSTRFDAGEALQLGLARLWLGGASLVVVEEPAEPLDDEAAAAVDAVLAELARQRAVVILATRLSTLRTADRVLLFHQGRLHAQGTHAALLQSNDLYRHLNYVRFNDFRDVPSG